MLLSAIGAAIHKENKMIAEIGENYRCYREQTPFIVPIPRKLKNLILIPTRLVLKKDWPENNRELLLVLIIYGIIVIAFSLPFYTLFHVPAGYLTYWWT